ncbi:hypothetical protein [Leifsonia sp. 21MFCrub1.1]|uniref:hypothetical protein n=1 Tax=Leifsonia sp. 21MFCrub1.1 TaxID=1798223 RepID=UPI0012FE1A44|nr:hypothetical protein [Leifsonia sp. 21MFCrub1.1]
MIKRLGNPVETDLQGLSYEHQPIGGSWEVELSNGLVFHVESDFVGNGADPVDFGSLVSAGGTGLTLTVVEIDQRFYRGSFTSDVALNPPSAHPGPRYFAQSELPRWNVLLSEEVTLTIAANSVLVEAGFVYFVISLKGEGDHWSEKIARLPVVQVKAIDSHDLQQGRL